MIPRPDFLVDLDVFRSQVSRLQWRRQPDFRDVAGPPVHDGQRVQPHLRHPGVVEPIHAQIVRAGVGGERLELGDTAGGRVEPGPAGAQRAPDDPLAVDLRAMGQRVAHAHVRLDLVGLDVEAREPAPGAVPDQVPRRILAHGIHAEIHIAVGADGDIVRAALEVFVTRAPAPVGAAAVLVAGLNGRVLHDGLAIAVRQRRHLGGARIQPAYAGRPVERQVVLGDDDLRFDALRTRERLRLQLHRRRTRNRGQVRDQVLPVEAHQLGVDADRIPVGVELACRERHPGHAVTLRVAGRVLGHAAVRRDLLHVIEDRVPARLVKLLLEPVGRQMAVAAVVQHHHLHAAIEARVVRQAQHPLGRRERARNDRRRLQREVLLRRAAGGDRRLGHRAVEPHGLRPHLVAARVELRERVRAVLIRIDRRRHRRPVGPCRHGHAFQWLAVGTPHRAGELVARSGAVGNGRQRCRERNRCDGESQEQHT